jgi:hypothetical protein
LYPYGDTRTETQPVHDDRDDRAARWTLRFFAIGAFVAVLGATLFVSLNALHDDAPAAKEATPAPVETVTTVAAPARIGPAPGTEIGAYVTARKAALASLKDERLAVVSATKYLTEAQAKTLAGTTPIVALLVAPPGMAPVVVTGDLATWANTATASTTAERDEIKKLLPTVTDPAFKSFYNAEVARLDKALKGFAPTSPLVFGLVVKAPAAPLQALGARPDVRLVDVAESATLGPNPEYRGLRPEETAKADDPSTRPA